MVVRVKCLTPLTWAQMLPTQHPHPPCYPPVWHILSHGTNIAPQHSPTPTQRTGSNLQIQTCKPSCTPKTSLPQGSQGETATWAEENYTKLKQLRHHAVAVLGKSVSLHEMTSPTPHF